MNIKYNKLVRDNIPEIIRNNNEIPYTRILNMSEFKVELENKLKEECDEVINSSGDERIIELADLLEVMIALAGLENKSLNDIILQCDEKRRKRGGFSKKIFLENVLNKEE